MFDHLLESSRWDDSNKWSNIGFGEEIGSIELHTLIGALHIFLIFIFAETFLILSSLGVTVKKEGLFSSTTRYYDMQHIEDIVIVEAVSLVSQVFNTFCTELYKEIDWITDF